LNKISSGAGPGKIEREDDRKRERSWLEGVVFARKLHCYSNKFKVQQGIVKTTPSDS
jgi:hypothetical protein